MPVVLLREKPSSWEGKMEWWLLRSLAHVTKAEISSQPTCSRSLRKHAMFLSQTNIGDTNFSLWEFWIFIISLEDYMKPSDFRSNTAGSNRAERVSYTCTPERREGLM